MTDYALTYRGMPLSEQAAVAMFANQEALIHSLQEQLAAARNELSCCDDVVLSDGLAAGIAYLREQRDAFHKELAAAREALQAADADAARYRWLSENADIDDVFYDDKVTLTIPAPDIDGFNDLSEVIDATLQRDRQP